MDIKQSVADEALKIVNGARRAAYGRPERNFERIARLWNAHLQNRAIIDRVTGKFITAADVAAMCRLIKEARLAETPDHRDSYVDIVGYALCQAEIALPGPGDLSKDIARECAAAKREIAVGDRVRTTKPDGGCTMEDGPPVGAEGEVVQFEGRERAPYLVDFKTPWPGGHSGGRPGAGRSRWYCTRDALEIVKEGAQ